MLNMIRHGADTALPPLVIVPGLFGSARNWGVVARNLSAERLVIAVDQRNHGDSFWNDDHSYGAMAGDIADVIAAQNRPCDVLGHSMGGKTVMTLALTHPTLVHRLIVADMAPKVYAHGESHGHLIAAMKALRLDDLTSRSDADKRLRDSIPDDGTRAFLLQSLELRDGPVRWKFNLDALQANMDRILAWPDPIAAHAAPFAQPSLFLYGTRSHYLQTTDHPMIMSLFPKAEFLGIEGAGHWLHAENPRAVEAAINAFLLHDA